MQTSSGIGKTDHEIIASVIRQWRPPS